MINRIAIIRLSALGDIIHTVPAVWLIKKNNPKTEITWFVEKGNDKLLECFKPFVNIETVSLRKKGFIDIIKEVKRLRKKFKNQFDLIIDFQGLIKSAILSFILGKSRIGFNKKNLKEIGADLFYNNSPAYIDDSGHVIYKNIFLAKYILNNFFESSKISDDISYPELKTFSNKNIHNFMEKHSINEKEFIIINIGGGWETKTLSVDQYENTINLLKRDFDIVILWGNEKEEKIAEDLAEKTGTIKSEFLKFNELIKFIELSKFIITSDTLALHLADIVKTPSIGIFGPTSPERNGSLNPLSKVVYKKFHCSPCHKKQCKNLKCIIQITENDILEKINELS